MLGADLLCDTLLSNGVDTCFANPGTSEMHFVAALDRKPRMRCILGLSEGVVTGMADGYGRMADKPAATLLHLGPGLANGLANLHNARRAHTPVLNVVGDHASYHLKNDAPLTSDIESLAWPMSQFVKRIGCAADVAKDARAAFEAAMSIPGVATLILPADAAWSEVSNAPKHQPYVPKQPVVDDKAVQAAAQAMTSGRKTALIMTGRALRAAGLEIAGCIATRTGADLLSQVSNGRIERGVGRVPVGKIPYPIDQAIAALKDYQAVILIGVSEPVAFFAYPGKPTHLLPKDCDIINLAGIADNHIETLAALSKAVDADGASSGAVTHAVAPPAIEDAALTAELACTVVARHIPDNAIICDESISSGRDFFDQTSHAAAHDYLQLTGGAIGIGIPLAAGAAVACPERKVIGLQADGSAMYTVQGLWTQAREGLDVVTIILSNRSYAILQGEMKNVGVDKVGRNASRMLSIDEPAIDWPSLARSLGVQSCRATTVAELELALEKAMAHKGPMLIEAVIA
ncbi:acetolactate synthase large subunit [Paracoccus sp. JM45]|uniref:acetolactate synthase large subunit n=1 Tax=Paracoccus sp. JM45 TaxID=2283626 RepID=UPI000E6D5402|nr:acetolactate synthase large subunit [Paracoccus sp. JM45]RJE78684.1 acetolactate synthase large subunit [Paracoccus sp. JM45]